ncbi:MAG TPA: hypothetical protein VNZ66_06090 [Aeromicrobium sp.]|nr:hypothetical protein [Aeromicrobium sp.]
MSTPSAPSPQATTLRILAAALCTSPLVLLAVLAFVLPTTWDDEPPVAVVLGLVVLVGVGFASAEAIGFLTEPLETSLGTRPDAARQVSLGRFQSSMLLRFALTEVPMLVGLAVSFVLDQGLWPLLTAVAVGLPVMWFETWPSRRNVTKYAARLEAGGVRSGLPETLGHA